ncbi:MAG TPA: peptide ABC transporter substrate-binding protein, partial [Terrimicrobiaceae bacterium]
MAESWTISDDKRTYTFKIRPNAKWSDGKPLTARDFAESWKRTLSPETAATYNYQLFYLKNAQAFAEGKITDFSQVGAKAIDGRTLEVILDNPTPFFLDLCATPPLHPVPTYRIKEFGDDWVKPGRMVSNGAYELEDWRINDKIRLRKNTHYWNFKGVALETVEILPISTATVAFNFYAGGLADLLIDKNLTPNALLDTLKTTPAFHTAPFLGIYFLRFNCSKPPFNDPRVRRAFAMTVDKRRIVEKITRAGELPAQGFVPPGIDGYQAIEELPSDFNEARRLLAEAGYPNGKDFPLTTFLYNESQQNRDIAVELQAMWHQELGVKVHLALQEWKVYLNSLFSLDY